MSTNRKSEDVTDNTKIAAAVDALNSLLENINGALGNYQWKSANSFNNSDVLVNPNDEAPLHPMALLVFKKPIDQNVLYGELKKIKSTNNAMIQFTLIPSPELGPFCRRYCLEVLDPELINELPNLCTLILDLGRPKQIDKQIENYNKTKFDFLKNYKERVNQPKWDLKGEAFIGKKVPANIKKLREILALFNDTIKTDIEKINELINKVDNVLSKIDLTSPRDSEVRGLYLDIKKDMDALRPYMPTTAAKPYVPTPTTTKDSSFNEGGDDYHSPHGGL